MPSTRAASSPETSDRLRCARTAAASHRHPPAVAVNARLGRSALSSSTTSYGIAVRVGVDHVDQLGRCGPVHVQHLGDHGGHSAHRQVVQPQELHVRVVTPPRQRRRKRMRRVHVAIPVGPYQQQALDRPFAQYQVEEAERHAPGPLQVVDEQHHRPFPGRDRSQHLHARPGQPCRPRQRVPGVRRCPQQHRELRHHRRQQACVRSNTLREPPADLHQLVLRLGQQQPTQRPECLVDRVELQIPPVRVELAGDEPAVLAGHHGP